jgi:hypothetical protein
MQSIPGTFGLSGSVPATALRIYLNLELVVELPEYYLLNASSS